MSSSSTHHFLILALLARRFSVQGSQMNTTFHPTFLDFPELVRCAHRIRNFGVKLNANSVSWACASRSSWIKWSNESNISLSNAQQHLKQKKCSIALPTFLIAIKQRRAASSSTEHSTTSDQMNPTFHRA